MTSWPNRFVIRCGKAAQAAGRAPQQVQSVVHTAIDIAARHLVAEPRLMMVVNDR